jgi:hypothetical protein
MSDIHKDETSQNNLKTQMKIDLEKNKWLISMIEQKFQAYLDLALKIFLKNEFILKSFWNGIVIKLNQSNNLQNSKHYI